MSDEKAGPETLTPVPIEPKPDPRLEPYPPAAQPKPNGAEPAPELEERQVPPVVRLAAVEKLLVTVAAAMLQAQGTQAYQVRELAQDAYDTAGKSGDEFERQVLRRVGDGWADVADRMAARR